jgi:hypothetical protein
MPKKDKLDLANPNFLDILVDHRLLFVIILAGITVWLALYIPHLQTDPTLKSGVDTTSAAYQQYRKFV